MSTKSSSDYCLFLFTDSDRDAGLVLSACIASTFQASSQSTKSGGSLVIKASHYALPFLSHLAQVSAPSILELGAGCGIVGITLSRFLPKANIILTDLSEATEILDVNVGTSHSALRDRLAHQVLDWSHPLPPNIAETKWDMVLVADCTYNPDVVPDLVQTLKTLVTGNGAKMLKVVLAMKVRHDSELIFFDLMKEAGFVVGEKKCVPLPVLEGEDEEIEIFDFGYGT
jgi:predicted nicotinamide N-methyase